MLWTDLDVYQRRYEKTATALMAVERALRARRPLAGDEDEFLSLYTALAAADPDTFTVIWEDPFAYFWARLAYELTGWCLNPEPLPAGLGKYCASLGTEDSHRALALHLEEFKKFIIALDLKSGSTRSFDRPLHTMLPFSIPGTRLSVLGRGPIMVAGMTDGALELIENGIPSRLRLSADASSNPAAPRMVERPLVEYEDLELILKPETFCVPGIEGTHGFLDLPQDYQQQQIPLLREALALVERHQPAALEHLRELVQVIAFKPASAGDYSNVSFSDLPGAFILSAVQQSYWIADALIHELLHNRLFFIIDRNELLEGGRDATESSEFYSPWRDDPRPLSGLLHAVYVYIGVCKFWFSVCATCDTGVRRDYAEDQAVRAVAHLQIGVAQLRRHATFTEEGGRLFREMEREVGGLGAELRAMKLSPHAPATIARGDGQIVPFAIDKDGRAVSILESILAHAEKFDTHRQCGDLKSLLQLD